MLISNIKRLKETRINYFPIVMFGVASRPLKMFLKEGYRWRIGDGSEISIWSTPWLKSDLELIVSIACIKFFR